MADLARAAQWVRWTENGQRQQALWRSERGESAPAEVVLADDTWSADAAYRLLQQGQALLWRGDFNNARHLLQALVRRAARPARSDGRQQELALNEHSTPEQAAAAFHRYRQSQSARAELLSRLLIPLRADYSMPLRRAPDWREACSQAWGPPAAEPTVPNAADSGQDTAQKTGFAGLAGLPGLSGPSEPSEPSVASVIALRELLGLNSASEWRKNGVPVAALGAAPHPRIHPHYGVFSPLRGEYLQLVADAALPASLPADWVAFDIGTGTGVLAAILACRGCPVVLATDQDPRAVACAQDNVQRLGLQQQVQVLSADMFPPGQADLVVCNPPWLPLAAGSSLERAVYDEGGRMLAAFLGGLRAHLQPQGQGWLILSDLAERLGLRSRQALLQQIDVAGLQVLGRNDTRPQHRKSRDTADPLHAARAAEITSLWRLGPA